LRSSRAELRLQQLTNPVLSLDPVAKFQPRILLHHKQALQCGLERILQSLQMIPPHIETLVPLWTFPVPHVEPDELSPNLVRQLRRAAGHCRAFRTWLSRAGERAGVKISEDGGVGFELSDERSNAVDLALREQERISSARRSLQVAGWGSPRS
jgi:hypothetical protein